MAIVSKRESKTHLRTVLSENVEALATEEALLAIRKGVHFILASCGHTDSQYFQCILLILFLRRQKMQRPITSHVVPMTMTLRAHTIMALRNVLYVTHVVKTFRYRRFQMDKQSDRGSPEVKMFE